MSTLDVKKLQNGAKSVDADYVIDGCAKAWASFNAVTTTSLDDSLNVSSITDEATGQTKCALTSNISAAVYCTAGSLHNSNVAGSTAHSHGVYGAAHFPVSVSEIRSTGYQTNTNIYADIGHLSWAIHGDLA